MERCSRFVQWIGLHLDDWIDIDLDWSLWLKDIYWSDFDHSSALLIRQVHILGRLGRQAFRLHTEDRSPCHQLQKSRTTEKERLRSSHYHGWLIPRRRCLLALVPQVQSHENPAKLFGRWDDSVLALRSAQDTRMGYLAKNRRRVLVSKLTVSLHCSDALTGDASRLYAATFSLKGMLYQLAFRSGYHSW